MYNKKGIVIVAVLGIIALLMIIGISASYLVTNENVFSRNIKDAKMALAAAQAGAQRGLARLLNNYQTINFSGALGQAQYNVTYQKVDQDGLEETWEIDSTGTCNGASKVVVVRIVVKKNVPFVPFATDGKFNTAKMQIPNAFDSLLEIWAASGFQIDKAVGVNPSDINNLSYGQDYTVNSWNVKFVHHEAPTPSVKSISFDVTNYAGECDVGDFSKDISLSSTNLVDINGDGKVVICGNDVKIDKNVEITNDQFVVFANKDIIVDEKLDEHGNNPIFDVALFANQDVVFEDKAEIEHHGKADTYNITAYAGDEIKSDTDHFIHVTGFSTAEQKANIFLVSKNGIDASDANIHYTGKESNNLLIWSDGDITLGKWHATGSSGDEVRKVGIIAHSDDPIRDPSDITFTEKIHITGSHHMEGLTVDDIQKWYEQLPEGDPTKAILAGMLSQISSSNTNVTLTLQKIDFWRVE